ncbi:diacylglycerol kinase [Caldalkalibacillus salinus]|uniref:diacylglycerol kinase n=1 Tax=Caldalkalibacillus salinus TaxID=2803787 RepID=UPI00192280E2|nr:diacylglycerol kinase [Caldalkalibacillus salinus]
MQKARIIYNPTSGRELVKKKLPDILVTLEQAGYETSAHATTGEGDATRAAQDTIRRGVDLVVAAGGDGTVYEVINGLAEQEHRPQLGILPAGTTNDFARALGIPRDLDEACNIIVAGHTQPTDIGKINDQYFINVAGGGTLTELTYEVPSKWKTMLGQLAYYAKGVEKLALLKPTRVHLKTKDTFIDEEIMMFLVANSQSIGGLNKIAPEANLQDGLFDVLVVKKTSIPEFIKIVTLALRGEHFKDPRVIYFRTRELKVTSKNNVQMNLDGEFGGHLPAHFKVLHEHLHVFVPLRPKNKQITETK